MEPDVKDNRKVKLSCRNVWKVYGSQPEQFFNSLNVLTKLVVPCFMDSRIGICLLLVSGVNKNKGIIKNAYQIAHNGPIILICS